MPGGTVTASVLKDPASATDNIATNASGSVTIGNALTVTGAAAIGTTANVTGLLTVGASGIQFNDGTTLTTGSSVPSGSMMPYAGSSAPSGWLLADGSAVSRTTYAALFAAIGTSWGAGNGTTTFNIPDMRSRVPVGSGTATISEDVLAASVSTTGDTFTVVANVSPKTKWATGMPVVLTTTGTLPAPLALATTYYVIRVTSTTIQVAATLIDALSGTQINLTTQGTGTHTLTSTMTSMTLAEVFGVQGNGDMPYHNHSYPNLSFRYGTTGGTGTFGNQINGTNGSATAQGTATMSFTGVQEAVTNMPPTAVVNYIIKT